jgi:DNA-binding NtrC family response regulator
MLSVNYQFGAKDALPRKERSTERALRTAGSEETCARILVVEDEALLRMALADALREAGHVVVETSTADSGWRFLLTDRHVDLVVSDIRTPGGIDGLDLAKRIGAQYPHLPVILTTGHNPRPEAVKDLQFPLQILRKPFALDTLVRLIVRALLRSRKGT